MLHQVTINSKKPFFYRDEDVHTVDDILRKQPYWIKQLDFKPNLIIDGGANIGMSAVFFANRYPNAHIISVEPEKNNYALLVKNVQPYDNVIPVRSAIWPSKTIVTVVDKGLGVAAFMVEERNSEETIKTVTIPMLAKKYETIDILKLDIEGAEKELFEDPDVDSWLQKTKVLIIEIHDRMKPGCSYAFFNAIYKYKWHLHINGENIILINLRYFHYETTDIRTQ